MALHGCPECGHLVSDRATACPNCGAPGGSALVSTQPSIEEWVRSRLTTGSPRREVVEELVRHGALAKTDAEALVKRVEAAALTTVPDKSRVTLVVTSGLLVLLLLLAFMLLRAPPGP
jgi:uncharacterized OB-fold protein